MTYFRITQEAITIGTQQKPEGMRWFLFPGGQESNSQKPIKGDSIGWLKKEIQVIRQLASNGQSDKEKGIQKKILAAQKISGSICNMLRIIVLCAYLLENSLFFLITSKCD